MRRNITLLLGIFILMGCSCALEINLSTDKKETEISADIKQVTIKTGEIITFYVKVKDAGSSAGSFTLSWEVKENTYKLIGDPHFVIASCGCKGAKGGDDINDYLSYVPAEPGKYRADATYGGHGNRIEFFVEPSDVYATATSTTIPTTTSSTSTTTSTTTPSTANPLVSSTSIGTTTVTEENEAAVTSTAAGTYMPLTETAGESGSCGCKSPYMIVTAVFLPVVIVYLGERYVERKKYEKK